MIALPKFDVGRLTEADRPPEARGVARDGVRLMVARRSTGEIAHANFDELPDYLDPGDLVVINTSGTLAAAVDAVGESGEALVIHFSTQLTDALWAVEPRRPAPGAPKRLVGQAPPRRMRLRGEGAIEMIEPYLGSDRLWVARLDIDSDPSDWMRRHGRPIRYHYVPGNWPLDSYQNDYAIEAGSAEMPSAGRPLTARVITRLVAKGVGVTPITLHAGVSSLEANELPFPERVVVPAITASRVNEARRLGGTVLAIGTTVVRALETAAGEDGAVSPLDGWTDLVVTPERGVRVIDGIVTGWHEPEASHLLMLEAIAGTEMLLRCYEESLAEGYLWHEFGDSHLILP